MISGYTINVSKNMPQKVASGFDKVFEGWTGAKYVPIAYLGSKQVENGINHALLVEQNLITAQDVHSIVLLILHDKVGDADGSQLNVAEIKPIFSNGGKQLLGGITIAPTTDIPGDAQAIFDKHYAGFLGANTKAFALLATQMVNGVAYYFAVESTIVGNHVSDEINSVVVDPTIKTIQIVTLYSYFNQIDTIDVLSGFAPVMKSDGSAPTDASVRPLIPAALADVNWP